MSYAIEVLKKERDRIELILENWSATSFAPARKDRERKLAEINAAIEKLENG